MAVLTHTFTQTPAATFIMLLRPIHHIPLSPHSSLRHRHGVSKHLVEFRAVVGFLMFYSEPLTVHNSPQRGGNGRRTHVYVIWMVCAQVQMQTVYSAFILCGPEWWHLFALDGRGISLILFDLRDDKSDSRIVLRSICPVTEKITGLLAKSFWHHSLKKTRRDTIHIVCTK